VNLKLGRRNGPPAEKSSGWIRQISNQDEIYTATTTAEAGEW
jgi:hypothetical protein